MRHKIIYVTYQSFPAKTANSLQTISNIKYLVKNNIDISLFFPLREQQSNDNINVLKEFYQCDTNFDVNGIKHYYPHGRIKIFKKTFYHISHYLWSKKTIKKYFKNNTTDTFFTRSDWIVYFLAKQKSNVVFEVHQSSKVRDIIIKKISNSSNVKIIFLNEKLKSNYGDILKIKNTVLHNGVDASLFKKNIKKDPKKIIFLGKLTRFNESRGIEKIIEFFRNEELKDNYTLEIFGDSHEEVENLRLLINKKNLENVITVNNWLNHKEAIEHIQKANFGLLINNPKNKHSYFYTSPLKYFEYLYANLKIIAVDFPSHRNLPLKQYINFFNINDLDSFKIALSDSKKMQQPTHEQLSSVTLEHRAKEIINFIN